MNSVLLLDKKMRTIVGDYVPKEQMLDDLVCFFSIFSDATRLRMVSALAITEMCVTDLSAVLGVNQTTVSHQLRLLRNLGAVNCRREGKIIYYSISDEIINDILLKGVEFLGR